MRCWFFWFLFFCGFCGVFVGGFVAFGGLVAWLVCIVGLFLWLGWVVCFLFVVWGVFVDGLVFVGGFWVFVFFLFCWFGVLFVRLDVLVCGGFLFFLRLC